MSWRAAERAWGWPSAKARETGGKKGGIAVEIKLMGIASSPLTRTPRHQHSDWEIVLYLEGQAVHMVGDTIFNVSPGMILCQPPGIPHETVSEQGFRDMYFQAGGFTPPGEKKIPVFTDDTERRFYTLFSYAYNSFHQREANYAAIINTLGEAMRQLLVSWSAVPEMDPAISAFETLLAENLTNPAFRVGEAMEKTGYCTDYFRRRFKRETGMTPVAYLTDLRVQYAKKLLRQQRVSGLTTREIAQMAGFPDPYYFSRVFRKAVGISPSRYGAHEEGEH